MTRSELTTMQDGYGHELHIGDPVYFCKKCYRSAELDSGVVLCFAKHAGKPYVVITNKNDFEKVRAQVLSGKKLMNLIYGITNNVAPSDVVLDVEHVQVFPELSKVAWKWTAKFKDGNVESDTYGGFECIADAVLSLKAELNKLDSSWGLDANAIKKLDVKQALEGFSIRNADGETVDYVMFEDK